GWFNFGNPLDDLHVLQTAVWEDKQVAFSYHAIGRGAIQHSCIDAYALVSKADKWYLVGRKPNGDYRTYRLNRLHALTVLDSQFERDSTFNLADYWHASRHRFQQQMDKTFPPYVVTLAIHPEIFWYFSSVLAGNFRQMGEPDAQGWIT